MLRKRYQSIYVFFLIFFNIKSTGTSSRAFMGHLEAPLEFGPGRGVVELVSENRMVVGTLSGIVGKAVCLSC